MNNKKLIYILTTIITLFSFNMNVKAAQELTCVYERKKENIMLIQYKTGKKDIYYNEEGTSLDDKWEKVHGAKISINTNRGDEELTTCPLWVKKNKYFFINEEKKNRYKLIKGYDYVADFALVQVSAPRSSTDPENHLMVELDVSEYTGEKYTAACLYKRSVDITSNKEDNHYIQLNISAEDILFTEYDPLKQSHSGTNNKSKYRFNVDSEFTFSYYKEQYNGECPSSIVVKREVYAPLHATASDKTIWTTILKNYTSSNKDEATYMSYKLGGANPITNEPLSMESFYGGEIKFVAGNIESCEELFGDKLYGYFNVIWNLVKIGIPIILIGLGIADFAQAVFSGKEDNMKKVQGKFIKRVIIAVVIFLIPTLIGLLLNIASEVWPHIGSDICGIVF